MRFYTKEECDAWLEGRQRVKPDTVEGLPYLRMLYPSKPHRFYYFAYWIATELLYREPALLWITEWGIWGKLRELAPLLPASPALRRQPLAPRGARTPVPRLRS